jgi:hypothetical protein
MIHTTFFKSITNTTPEGEFPLSTILEGIKSDRWKAKIQGCIKDLSKKRWLPCFTPTGKFNNRSIAGLYEYNGVICLDIDHVDDPEALKEKCKDIEWCHAAFITPSYRGLKVIVLTDAGIENFTAMEFAVASKFKALTGYMRDDRCKDIARAQFISWDPNLYYNPASSVLNSQSTINNQ